MNHNNRNHNNMYPPPPPQRHHNHHRLPPPQPPTNLNPNAAHFQPQPYHFNQPHNHNQNGWNERFRPPPPQPPPQMQPQPTMNYNRPPPNFRPPYFSQPPPNIGQHFPPQLGPQPPHGAAPPFPPSTHHRPHINFHQTNPLPPPHFRHAATAMEPTLVPPQPPPQTPPVVDAKKMYKETMIDVVKKWLSCRNIQQYGNSKQHKNDVQQENEQNNLVKIHEYKSMVKDLFGKIETLRSMNDQLAENMEMSAESWTKLVDKVNTLKVEVLSMQDNVFQKNQVDYVENLLKQRKKKRKRQVNKKEERREEYKIEVSKRMKINQTIDEWQHKEFSSIQRKKMLESLKNEAGESLTEVKRKQNETEELLQVLQHLNELRNIRKQTAIYKGILVTKENDASFEAKIEESTQLLRVQSKIYEDEERALRVLREEEAEDFERNQVEQRKKRKQKHQRALSSWDPMAIFRSYWCQGEENISGLIQIRSLWDSFLCGPLTPGCSRLPDDFPDACEPTTHQWEKFLLKMEKTKNLTNVVASVCNE